MALVSIRSVNKVYDGVHDVVELVDVFQDYLRHALSLISLDNTRRVFSSASSPQLKKRGEQIQPFTEPVRPDT